MEKSEVSRIWDTMDWTTKCEDGEWFVVRCNDGSTVAGPFDTNAEAYRHIERVSREPRNTRETMIEY